MIRRPPRSTRVRSSAASDVYKRQSSVFPIELSLAVASALDRLSTDQREAVVLKIYQGFKFEEMAEILSCPVSTIKSRLYTALELLKLELAPMKARGVS